MLTIITPAPSQRLTTADALNAETGNTSSDNSVTFSLIDAASSSVSDYCGRVFGKEIVAQTIEVTRSAACLILARYPVASITSVTIDGEAITADQYEIDRHKGLIYRLCSGRRQPWPCGRVVITYAGGYVLPGETDRNLPARIEQATIELARSLWYRRRRDPLLRSVEIPGVISEDYTIADNAAEMPPAVVGLLEGLRSVEFA
jgi:hypothetical protein